MRKPRPHIDDAAVQERLCAARQEALGAVFARLAHEMGNLLGNAQMRLEFLLEQSQADAAQSERLRNALGKVERLIELVGAWRNWVDAPHHLPADAVGLASEAHYLAAPFLATLGGEVTLDTSAAPDARLPVSTYAAVEEGMLRFLTAMLQQRPPEPFVLTLRHDESRDAVTLRLAPQHATGEETNGAANYLHQVARHVKQAPPMRGVELGESEGALELRVMLGDDEAGSAHRR